MRGTPVKRVAMPTLIAQQIQEMVQNGELKPREKLPSERELCEQFDASRTAVREGIAALISKGILERRNKGIFVCEINNRIVTESMELLISAKNISISDVLEARSILEIENAGLAALRASEQDIEFLQRCVQKIEDPSNSEAVIRDAAADFHRGVARATHNSLIEDFFMVLYDVFYNDPRSIATVSESANSHRDILVKIIQRDESGARKEMKKHLEIVRRSY